MTYAKRSKVAANTTRTQIENVLARYGATGFAYGTEAKHAVIAFQTHDRRVKFTLPLIVPLEFNQARAAQFTRSRWRALLLAIKAKLASVEAGIESFDEAFLSHVVMPDGKTMAEHALPFVKEAYSSGAMPHTPLIGYGG
jgi:hypothetical protein